MELMASEETPELSLEPSLMSEYKEKALQTRKQLRTRPKSSTLTLDLPAFRLKNVDNQVTLIVVIQWSSCLKERVLLAGGPNESGQTHCPT